MNKFLILLVLFVFYVLLFKDKDNTITESLENIGYPNKVFAAPIAYNDFAKNIKYPSDITDSNTKTEIEGILDSNVYNSNLFNQRALTNYYSIQNVEEDIKYFNSNTNLILQQQFN